MKTKTMIVATGLAALVGALVPATVAAHGGDPHDMAEAMQMSMMRPMMMKGGGKVTIVHVQKGCHVWSRGSASAPGLRVVLKRGQRLTFVNHDLDAHRFVRVAGPKIALGKTMQMNCRVTLTFRKKGLYKLRTKRIDVPGTPEFKTTGPDNVLVVHVIVR